MHLGVALNSCAENPSTADIGWGVSQSNSPYRQTSGGIRHCASPGLAAPSTPDEYAIDNHSHTYDTRSGWGLETVR